MSTNQGRAYCVPETGAVYVEGDLTYATWPRGSSLHDSLRLARLRYTGPPEGGLASRRDVLKELMGDWLGKLAPWNAFGTWTFSKPVNVDGAMYMGRRHLGWIEAVAGVPIYAFVAAEKGDVGGLIHLHSLIGNVAHLKPWCGEKLPPGKWRASCCLLHAWPCGYARVFPYDPALGAKHYVSKYVCGQLAEWDLLGFPAIPQPALISSSLKMKRGKHRVL
jgi:hypothetical protein